MKPSKTYIDQLIDNQRKLIKYHFIFACCLFGIGMLIIAITLIWFSTKKNDELKTIISIGGFFTSSISAFPIKDVIKRREKIGIFRILRSCHLEDNNSESTKANELIWKTIEKIALG